MRQCWNARRSIAVIWTSWKYMVHWFPISNTLNSSTSILLHFLWQQFCFSRACCTDQFCFSSSSMNSWSLMWYSRASQSDSRRCIFHRHCLLFIWCYACSKLHILGGGFCGSSLPPACFFANLTVALLIRLLWCLKPEHLYYSFSAAAKRKCQGCLFAECWTEHPISSDWYLQM